MSKNNSVYNELVKIVKFRFAKELQCTDIELKSLYHAKNIVSQQTGFLLNVDGYCIKFITPRHFIDGFISFLNKSIERQKDEYDRLQNIKNEFIDEMSLETAIKSQYMVVYKQEQLLQKFLEFKEGLKHSTKN
nr:hypothetical protein [uncultured Draconibacterium sp.]